jgi:dynein heavy chain
LIQRKKKNKKKKKKKKTENGKTQMAEELELNDSRVEFMAVYIMKSLKVKGDKFTKLYAIEDYKIMVHEFLDKNEQNLLVFSISPSAGLSISYNYPTSIKTKAVYFAKKNKEAVSKDMNIKDALLYGDLSYSPIEQLSAILDELLVPVIGNSQNQGDWPKVISSDLIRHVNNLKNKTHVLSGQMKGKTQLPIPAGADKVSDEDLRLAEQ